MTTFSALNEKEQELQEMVRAGLHVGHRKSRSHPGMKAHVLTVRSGVQIINLEHTYDLLRAALEFLHRAVSEGKSVLLVGTAPSAQKAIEAAARTCEVPWVSTRWIGGTITNFPTIYKGISTFLDLEGKKRTGELEKYTKKEKNLLLKKLDKLQEKFGGLRLLKSVPDILFIIDAKKHTIAVNEAKKIGRAIIAVVDTDTNPKGVDFVIPASDNARPAVEYILEKVKAAITDAKQEAKQRATEVKKSAPAAKNE